MIRALDLSCRGAFYGLAAFAVAAHGLLLAGLAAPTWLPLPAFAVGALWAARAPMPASPGDRRLARGWTLAASLVILGIAAALAVGALGTPSRYWDGMVTWDVRATFLTAQPTLEQDYFRDPDIYAHSRDYPLLQPLLIALGNRAFGGDAGRVLFPLLYLLAVGTVASALRRVSVRAEIAALCAVAFAVTPMLVNPTSGSADSGYGELLLAASVLCIGAGVVARSPSQVAAGVVLAVVSKPEGLLYGLLPVVVAFASANRRMFAAGLVGWLAAISLWLPIQYGLNHAGALPPVGLWGGIAGVGVLLWAIGSCADRLGVGVRARMLAVGLAIPVMFLALPWLSALLASIGGTMEVYLGDEARPWQRYSRLLAVVAGMADHALVRLRFALAYWCALAAFVAMLCRRARGFGELPLLLGLGLVSLPVPFLLSPENDLDHHLRSTMSRLLLHWLGVAWLFVGVEWQAAESRAEVRAHPGSATAAREPLV